MVVQTPTLAELRGDIGVVDEFARHSDREIARCCAARGVGGIDGQILEREGCFAIGAIGRHDSDRCSLALDVAIGPCGTADTLGAGIEQVEQEVTIALAIPSPVDVETALAIISITDKGMAC